MTEPIKVVIVDDIVETRDHLTKLSGSESDMVVAGSVGLGRRGIEACDRERGRRAPSRRQHAGHGRDSHSGAAVRSCPNDLGHHDERPGRTGLSPPRDARRSARIPGQAVFVGRALGVHSAGPSARSPEAGPLAASTMPAATSGNGVHIDTPRRGPGQVVTFFAPKGGVGRTTLAVNFAVAAKTELNKRVALVDGGLQFGDVGVLLNLNPKNQSIADLARPRRRRPRTPDPATTDAQPPPWCGPLRVQVYHRDRTVKRLLPCGDEVGPTGSEEISF